MLLSLGLIGLGTTAIDYIVGVNLQRVELHGHHHLETHGIPLHVALALKEVLAADLLDFVNGQLVLADAYGLAFQLGVACCGRCGVRYLNLL